MNESDYTWSDRPDDSSRDQGDETRKWTPPKLGQYEILEEVGRGGMGVVYRAHHSVLKKNVALKVIRAGEFAGKEDIHRFHREAETAARLDHPAIIPVYELGESNGHHFLTMLFVEGTSLSQRLRRGPLPPELAAEYTLTISKAIQHAHSHRVIHRDLKPGNVLVCEDGKIWIGDFGLARRLDGCTDLTSTGQILGTPGYMAPEQASGGESGPLTDIFGIGSTFYAMLVGQSPFRAKSVAESIRLTIEQDPCSPCSLVPSVPRELETICLKCLEKDPASRYQSADDLADELERYLSKRPIASIRVGKVKRFRKWFNRQQPILRMSILLAIVLPMAVGTAIGGVAIYNKVIDSRKIAERDNIIGETVSELNVDGVNNSERADLKGSAAVHRAAIRTLEKIPESREQRHSLAVHLMNLGITQADQGSFEEAEKAFLRSRAIRLKLVSSGNETDLLELVRVLDNLAVLYNITDHPKQSEKALREAILHATSLVGRDGPNPRPEFEVSLLKCKSGLASHLIKSGQWDTGMQSLLELITGFDTLEKEHPGQREIQTEHARVLRQLANGYYGKMLWVRALEYYEESANLYKQLKRRFPDFPEYSRLLALSRENAAMVYSNTGQMLEAEAAFTEVSELRKLLVENYPGVPQFKKDLASSYNSQAVLYGRANREELAIQYYQSSVEIQEQLVEQFPDHIRYLAALGNSLTNLGNRLRETDLPLATRHHRRAVELLHRAHAQNSLSVSWTEYLTRALTELAYSLLQHEDSSDRAAEALEHADRALELSQDRSDHVLSFTRILALADLGNHKEAVAQVDEWIDSPQVPVIFLMNMARVYSVSATHAADPRLREQYVEQGMQALVRAQSDGLKAFEKKKINSSIHFATLRDHPDFQDLLSDSNQ